MAFVDPLVGPSGDGLAWDTRRSLDAMQRQLGRVSVRQFDNVAARSKAVTQPVVGQLVFMLDTNQYQWWDGSAWQVLLDATLKTWTPTWTNITIGNAAVTGSYMQVGKTVHLWLVVTFGSTSAFGASDYRFSLPVNAGSVPSYVNVLYVANGNAYTGYVDINNTAGFLRLQNVAGTYPVPTQLGPAAPNTWGNGSQILVSGTYLAA